MFPASTNSAAGQCMAVPDVCKTPTPAGPVPIPYPNLAMPSQAITPTLAMTVKLTGFYAATTLTQIAMSSGDEAGAVGGVVSNMIKGPCQYKLGSQTVKFQGQQAVYLGSLIAHNNTSNANMPAGSQIAPSQGTVTVGP